MGIVGTDPARLEPSGSSRSLAAPVARRWADRLMSGRWRWPCRVLFVLLFVLPTLVLMIVSISTYSGESTRFVMRAKELQGELAAAVARERMNAQLSLAASFATRPLLVRNIEQGRWQAALQVLDGVAEYNPHITGIELLDPDATIEAEMPSMGVVGQNRSDMEWYRDLSQRWKPRLSVVSRGLAESARPVVSVAVPVLPLGTTAALPGRPLAILHLQLASDGFWDWTQMDVGHKGRIYLCDQHGNLVHDSRRRTGEGFVDFSSLEPVKNALAGHGGIGMYYDPVEKELSLAAYQPLPAVGWGIVVTQVADEAFAVRNHNVRRSYFTYLTLTSVALLLSLALLRIVMLQKAAEDRQRQLALIDELTGLNNRRGFMSSAAVQMSAAARLKQKLFLIYADLDRMKQINDRYGHKEGDRALVDTAQILRAAFRQIDVKARIGGDEFVVLGAVQEGFDVEVAKSRLRKVRAGYLAENLRPYQLSLSIGVVLYDPERPCSLDELMARGDQIMYGLKKEPHRSPSGLAVLPSAPYAADDGSNRRTPGTA